MNIILGVEGQDGAEPLPIVASLLRRLRLPQAAIDVVHVLAPLVPYGTWGMDMVLTGEAFADAELASQESAQKLVTQVAIQLRVNGPSLPEEVDAAPVRAFVHRSSSIIGGLLEQADESHADLIAIDGPHSGPLGAFLSGSVARSLVIDSNRHSLLIAKDPQANLRADQRPPTPKDEMAADSAEEITSVTGPDTPLRVVFATDHSPYANLCLKQLIRLSPRGISHLTVMTAYPEEEITRIGRWLPNLAIHPQTAVRQSLAAHNEGVLRKLKPLLDIDGATSESRVIGSPVNEAIETTMHETGADLLIMGARGLGFVDRLTLGSVSFHQAMTSPYSLLILRA